MTIAAPVDEVIKQNLEQFLLVLSVSLGVATISRIFSWLRQIPYTLLLVIVGSVLSFVNIRFVNLSPELILEIFLPPLLFEAAWNVRWRELKNNSLPVALYTVGGVLISIAVIGFALNQFTNLPLPIALLVGASLSTTDPVSVVALFREVGASKRLTVLMEGESLFNDGVAVVAFVILVDLPFGVTSFTVEDTLARFLLFVGVGVAVGCVVGFGLSYLTQRFDLPVVEQSITLVSAYGTYLLTEELGGSGVIGVVLVGLILGNFGSRIGMNPRTRLLVSEFWEFLAFLVNSIVFLLIGDQIKISSLADNFNLIVVAIIATLLSRAAAIYPLSALSNLITKKDINLREQTALWWGGLRGSVSIALALSVPAILPGRQAIIETVFGVVLFTLLFQGITTKFVLNKLELVGDEPIRQSYEELLAKRLAMQRVLDFLEKADYNSLEPNSEIYAQRKELVKTKLEQVEQSINQLQNDHPEIKTLDFEQLAEQLLNIETDTYAELIRSGRLDSNPYPILKEIIADSEVAG
ncbi:MAG: sodium:proton antiporter [Cyanobacteriota bacterium ELA615]|jgi:CPA1 family monovalent cation:H+ antiporter